jgi:alkylation response protein AidB-like acyl-CoA dehydrogenase
MSGAARHRTLDIQRAGSRQPLALGDERTAALLQEIAAGAAERERERLSPSVEIRRLAAAGLGAVRVPRELGGAGWTLRELFDFLLALAAADSNIAQSLRAHYHFVEGRIAADDEHERSRWLALALKGALFGNGTIERSTKELFGIETTLLRGEDGLELNGTKYYSTGSLYADWVSVLAKGADDRRFSAIVPVDRDGVTIEDDWDSMGQRLTASGTSRFVNVQVNDEEVLSARDPADATPRTTFLQLYLVAVSAGIARACADDAASLVRARRRTFSHGASPQPTEDPLIQQVVGQLASWAIACRASVLDAADALDEIDLARRAGAQPPSDELFHAAALRAAAAQVLVRELSVRAAEMLFEVGGASATDRELNLDRHWRNARTLASHNPAMFKAKAIGDLWINDTPLPGNGFF